MLTFLLLVKLQFPDFFKLLFKKERKRVQKSLISEKKRYVRVTILNELICRVIDLQSY